MVRSHAVEGMPVDLSPTPPKCEACILGKQTRTAVPKLREGERATAPLERIFVDLCGPMSIPSRTGRLYSMNIIDDFSSFVWSLPLHSKSDAFPSFRHWLTAVELHTSHRLKYIITDNGELTSNVMRDFCATKGILHLLTAPYTSAHNGRAERLHRTLMDKARAMRIACKAPPNIWDEFVATAAHLTNLTGSSANQGKTPYQLWHNRKPSLSHLREIGCRAFALIPGNNPKLLHRSVPCVLIGYAPNSKAYRLWDPFTDRIFNSYHVTFIERRELPSLPAPPTLTPAPPTSPHHLRQQAPPTHDQVTSHHVTFNPASSTNPAPLPSTSTLPLPPSLPLPSHPSLVTAPRQESNRNTVIPQVTNLNTVLPQESNCNTVIPPNINHNTHNILPQESNQNTVIPQERNRNTVIPQESNRNTVIPQESNRNTVIPQESNRNTVLPQDTVLSQHTFPSNNIPQLRLPQDQPHRPPALPPLPPAPSRLPVPRRSARIAALHPNTTSGDSAANISLHHFAPPDFSAAFLSEFAPLRDTHFLLPLELDFAHSCSSVGEALSALKYGATEITLDPNDDPLWRDAIASPEREYWVAGARDELKSLKDLTVFVLVPRAEIPKGQRPLKGKLVCKRKRDDVGNISRYKVRYVAKGFAQRYLIDYDKTTAPTARLESFRALLHIAATLDWDAQHFDIKTAFLHGVLPDSETVFMEQPPGFEEPGKEDWVWRLNKSLYGMKQASRIWNLTFHKTMEQLGFKRLVNEWCVYRRQTSTGTIIFAVHVDDIISIASSPDENATFKAQLARQWDISDLGAIKFALGIAITRDRASRTIHLSQHALIDRVVEQFGQSDAHPVDTPMVLGTKILRPDPTIPVTSDIQSWMDRTPYRSLVGTLNYIAVATRPDIAFVVGRLASVFDCYRPAHWDAAVRVVRYLKGTRLLNLELGGSNKIRPVSFSDSDYANCPDTSRSIGGYCLTLGSGMVSWASRKQQHATDSTCYAEYVAIHSTAAEILFLRQFLDGLDMPVFDATPLLCDNDSARQLTEDQKWHAKSKHFRVRYHTIRDLVNFDEVVVHGVPTADNTADIFTKALGPTAFARLRSSLGIRPSRVA
jgi:transposase InsO family protein